MDMDFLSDLENYIKIKQYRLVNSVLVFENGALVFERYFNKGAEDRRNQIKSVWKSVLSLTAGICLDKGLISGLDEPISRYLPEFGGNTAPYHMSITIRHLLTMSSGIYWNGGIHYHCPMMDQLLRCRDWVGHIASVKSADFPGTRFVYKEWDVILLSALIGRACGGSAWDVCSEYLYKPLGIVSERWTHSKCGIAYPSYGEDLTDALCARDMAKLGLLALRGGESSGRSVVSGEYIKAAVSPSQADSGYGYLWWLSGSGYHGRGFGGQELNVYPAKSIVAVIQATVTPSSKSYREICERIIG